MFPFCTEFPVQFQQAMYNVSEGDGIVTVCVELEAEFSESISVFVSVTPESAMDGMQTN